MNGCLDVEPLLLSVKVVDTSISRWAAWHTTSWHSTAWETSWHTSWHSTGSWHSSSTSLLIDSHHDGVEFGLELLLLAFDGVTISLGVSFKPLKSFLGGFLNNSNLISGEFSLELLFVKGVLHLEAVVLESILGLDLLLCELILSLIFLSILNHLFDFLLGESTFVVGDGDLGLLSSSLINGRDVEDTVGINIEGDLNLWNTSWSWWDTFKVEFTELMAILGHLSLTFKDLDQYTGLVILIGSESLRLFGWDGGVSLDDVSHDTTGGLDSHGKWGNIEEKELGSLLITLSGKNGGLDGSTESNSLIWVDGFVEDLSVEEIGEHRLDLWNSSGSTDENDLVNLTFTDSGILEYVLYWRHALSEEIHAQLLELSSGDVGVIVLTFSKGLALNWGLMRSGENSLGFLALSSESSEGSWVLGNIDAGLLLEVGHAEVDELVIEVLSSQMGVTIGGFYLEDTFLDGKEGDIESTSTKIEDEDVSLLLSLSVKAVGDGSSGWLVNDSKNVQTRDGSGILGGLSLRVVEISWDGNDGGINCLSEVRLSDFLHLNKNHR